MPMLFQYATIADLSGLVSLINRAYRGDTSRIGWTTEADLLEGLRIDEKTLQELLQSPDSLIFTVRKQDDIVATIHARHAYDGIHLGLFAVEPSLQGRGIGKQLLAYAEEHAEEKWGTHTFLMEVITLRNELIRYYERHGYRETGAHLPFPLSELWQLRVPNLEMTVLSKKMV